MRESVCGTFEKWRDVQVESATCPHNGHREVLNSKIQNGARLTGSQFPGSVGSVGLRIGNGLTGAKTICAKNDAVQWRFST
jgi:hypothetical protein